MRGSHELVNCSLRDRVCYFKGFFGARLGFVRAGGMPDKKTPPHQRRERRGDVTR
jgi:hypothetical protein